MNVPRPPLRAALAASVGVLVIYFLTLAPTVTFWDAGELITAARTLGIPHPPGTPLFVLMAHVWGMIFPIGDYAWRLNLFSAVASAVTAGCWFLVCWDAAYRMSRDDAPDTQQRLALLAGFAAASLTAFGFTTWQNSTETEVYSVAMLLVALMAVVVTRWRGLRTDGRSSRLLLVLLYLGSMSIGNHLLALLAGPALVALLIFAARHDPLPDSDQRAGERARIAMVGTIWLLLIALGLGSGLLTLTAGVLVLIATGYASRNRQLAFASLAWLIVIVGMSTYLFLLLRARQAPWLNESDPSTWRAVLGVIRRAQYPVRTPLDDPTILHGPNNPGRTLTMLAFQLANFAQYFDWQWAKSIGPTVPTSPLRVAFTLVFAALALLGAMQQYRRDRGGFWFVGMLFLVTGLGLVIYMDFKPGPSIGWDQWPALEDHEVRERDYFFVASFVAAGLWAAMGMAEMARRLVRRAGAISWSPAYAVFAMALIPLALNFRVATRRGGADETFARDFARALLQSVPPGGLLFTYGDNDTFPLWHAQAVDGVRRDVTVICLSLAETPWYMRELRSMVSEPVDRAQLASVWQAESATPVTWPLHTMDDASIEAFTPFIATQDLVTRLPNGLEARIVSGDAVYGKDALTLQVLRQNAGRRPIAWAVTAASRLYGLGPHLVMQGLALVLPVVPMDSSRLSRGLAHGEDQPRVDVETTRRLAMETWQFGHLLDAGVSGVDPSSALMASTVAIPMMQAGAGYFLRGDTVRAIPLLERAGRLTTDSTPGVLLRVIRGGRAGPPPR